MKAKEIKIFKKILTEERERLIQELDVREKNSLGKSLKDQVWRGFFL